MNIRAKVNFQSVKTFSEKTYAAKTYVNSFSKGIACLVLLQNVLSEKRKDIEESIAQIQTAKERLEKKIKDIEAEISQINERLCRLQDEISDLEYDLSMTPKEIASTDSEGEVVYVINPQYLAIENKINQVEAEINVVNKELYEAQEQLNRAQILLMKISKHIDSGKAMVYTISDKINLCKKLQFDFEIIKNQDEYASISAAENLNKIAKIIDRYKTRKMVYDSNPIVSGLELSIGNNKVNSKTKENTITEENADGFDNVEQKGDRSNINVQVFVNKSKTVNNNFSEKEIDKHHIMFDDDGHICEYDGKKFGGVYNSYDERIKGTSDNNPILGKYEGNRGESKYIPSNRTAEGIVVINILSRYGLDGIIYRNGEPDFEVCSEEVVKIQKMTEHRENYVDSSGQIQYGNFTQADMVLASKWNKGKKEGRDDWTGADVSAYRKKNRLTWHEKCDMETIVLVRTEINQFFRHIGGCSECRLRDSIGDVGGGFDE